MWLPTIWFETRASGFGRFDRSLSLQRSMTSIPVVVVSASEKLSADLGRSRPESTKRIMWRRNSRKTPANVRRILAAWRLKSLFFPPTTYDVTSDGHRFVMIKENEQVTSANAMNIVLNWFEEVKQKVPAKRWFFLEIRNLAFLRHHRSRTQRDAGARGTMNAGNAVRRTDIIKGDRLAQEPASSNAFAEGLVPFVSWFSASVHRPEPGTTSSMQSHSAKLGFPSHGRLAIIKRKELSAFQQ